MIHDTGEIERMIAEGIRSLVQTDAFQAWFKDQSTGDGDIILFNNSFIYRDLIKTVKNSQYLCIKVKDAKPEPGEIFVGDGWEQNNDFKLLSAKAGNLPSLRPLTDAVITELEHLGQLIFVLIGELKENPEVVTLNHATVKELRFDPSSPHDGMLERRRDGKWAIVANQLTDPSKAWQSIQLHLQNEHGIDLSRLKGDFDSAFETLQANARLTLCLPSSGSPTDGRSLLKHLAATVTRQREEYNQALDRYAGNATSSDPHLRDIMRIAYNFAGDAISILQLLVSIADLKGILLWCTIKQHFDVDKAFRGLPLIKSEKKAPLKGYREIIGGARNRAFHNLFEFDRTIEADLTGIQVNARRLTLFPAHKKARSAELFDYEDREIVEVLTAFTRAPETMVPLEFWEKNSVVIEAFEKLLKSTETALWALNHARP